MSKRKYADKVSIIVRASRFLGGPKDGEMGTFAYRFMKHEAGRVVPVRIVRESFYRKLIKAFERHKDDDAYWLARMVEVSKIGVGKK